MEKKSPFLSKTLWGIIVTATFTVMDAFGASIPGVTEESTMEIVNKTGELVGLLWAAYGRFKANKAIA